jgi:DNA adenine methylase
MALSCLVPRFGGKSKLKKIIVENYFPDDYESMVYVEPFVGGGSIFFHKNPSVVEVINDLDIAIYSIFNGAKKFSRADIAKELDGEHNKEYYINNLKSSPTDEFSLFCKHYYNLKSSIMCAGRGYDYSKTKMKVKLEGYKERLEDVIIYNTDYKELITKYDSDETFFYLDPPYEKSHIVYTNHKMNMNDMFDLLSNIKGKFLLSFNNSNSVRELFKDFNIYEVETKYAAGHGCVREDNKVIELLISNYDCV